MLNIEPRKKPLVNGAPKHKYFFPQKIGKSYLVPRYFLPKQKYFAIEVLDDQLLDTSETFLFAGDNQSFIAILMSSYFPIWVSGFESSAIEPELHIYTFPFPEITKKQEKELAIASGRVFNVRERISGEKLSDLYQKGQMRESLIMAHEELDRVVNSIYGLPEKANNEQILEVLKNRYQVLLENA